MHYKISYVVKLTYIIKFYLSVLGPNVRFCYFFRYLKNTDCYTLYYIS